MDDTDDGGGVDKDGGGVQEKAQWLVCECG